LATSYGNISGNPGATGPPVDLDRLFETLLISHL